MATSARLAVYVIVPGSSMPELRHLHQELARSQIPALFRSNTEYKPNTYTLPAGRVLDGESPLQAASRELEEETDMIVELENLELCGVMYRHPDFGSTDHWIDLFYVAHKVHGTLKNAEPHLHSEARMFLVPEILNGGVPNFMSHQLAFLSEWAERPEGTTVYMEFDPRV